MDRSDSMEKICMQFVANNQNTQANEFPLILFDMKSHLDEMNFILMNFLLSVFFYSKQNIFLLKEKLLFFRTIWT